MEKFRLRSLTPDGTVLDRDVAGLYLRGADGDLAVFAGHVPFVTPVKAGNCTVVTGEDSGNDIEGRIGTGTLRVASKEVLLLVKSYE